MRISTNGRYSTLCTAGACRGEVHMKEKDSVENNEKSPDNRKKSGEKIISDNKDGMLYPVRLERRSQVRAEKIRWV